MISLTGLVLISEKYLNMYTWMLARGLARRHLLSAAIPLTPSLTQTVFTPCTVRNRRLHVHIQG